MPAFDERFLLIYRITLFIAATACPFIIIRKIITVSNRYYIALLIMASFYPIGKCAAMWIVGPWWVRWYLDDFGFVAFMTCVWPSTQLYYINSLSLDVIQKATVAAKVGFVGANWVELFILFTKPFIKHHRKFEATGDPWDVVMFSTSFLVVMWLLTMLKHDYMPTTSIKTTHKVPRTNTAKRRERKRFARDAMLELT